MSREWKPGDVGLNDAHGYRSIYVEYCSITEHGRAGGACWHNESGLSDPPNSPRRPLVVIDPEDREAVERLTGAVIGFDFDLGVDRMQAALREYANPTPPKPDEPTGWLAVVKDADGDKWVRDGLPNDRATRGEWWNHSCAARGYVGGDLRADYDEIAAVRVLSPGVEVSA